MDIIVSSVTKRFADKLVLDRFSAIFPANEVSCIMGASGCGKTTLLNILMGQTLQDSGTVSGVPLLKSAVFQEDRLCENFSALSNIRLVCGKMILDGQIISNLKAIGLGDAIGKPVNEFSGGMKRRVAIVRAILAKSDIIFLDEPFKGLDNNTKLETIAYLKKFINGRTVIMVTHNIQEAKAFDAKLFYVGCLTSESIYDDAIIE